MVTTKQRNASSIVTDKTDYEIAVAELRELLARLVAERWLRLQPDSDNENSARPSTGSDL